MTDNFDKWKFFDYLEYKVNHKEVKRFHDSKAKIRVCCAPRRTTKSYSAAKEVLTTVVQPNKRIWIVGPNYGLAEKEFRYIHDDITVKLVKMGWPKPIYSACDARSGRLYLKTAWGTEVVGKSSDNPSSLLGDAVDAVIYSEAAQLPRAIRERYVASTLNTTNGYEVIPTTPSASAEWVHELYMIGQEGNIPEVESFHWDVSANPIYGMDEYERAKRLHGEDSPVFREQYLGEWVFYAGVVYPTFDPGLHVIEPFDIPYDWPKFRMIDFGHRDPFCCLWGTVGPHDEVYVYREYYNRDGMPIKYHVGMIKDLTKDEKISQTVGDPSSAQAIDDMCYEGLPVIPANNDRGAGRLRVSEYLLPTPDGPAPYPIYGTVTASIRSKYPRLYIFNTCKELQRELKFYRWAEGKEKEGEKEKTEGSDHACLHPDTLVITREGKIKISDLIGTTGEILNLNNEYETYTNCSLTGKNKRIVEILFNDGSRIKCTPDHKFLTPDGWIEAIDMAGKYCYSSISNPISRKTWLKLFQNQCRNLWAQSIIFAGNISQIRKVINLSGFIGKYGNIIMVKYPKVIMSTILTKIGQTIVYPTLNYCLNLNTYPYTPKIIYGISLHKQDYQHPFGMEAKKAGYGIKNILRILGINSSKDQISYVGNVEKNTLLKSWGKISSVPITVDQKIGENQGLITKKDTVQNVKMSLPVISMKKIKPAQESVLLKSLSVKDAGISDVYCLYVPNTHSFAIESGQISHNCDSLRYGLMTRPSPFRQSFHAPSNSFMGWLSKIRSKKSDGQYIGVDNG